MKLAWGEIDDQTYEAGLDRGVLYVDGLDGVAWNGLINVTESPSGGEARPLYIDGIKYLNLASGEEFAGNITAFYSPEEFDLCDGSLALKPGVLANQQVRRPFCFSFRTRIGNASAGQDFGYKIHIVYNALATPSIRKYSSLSDSIDLLNLNWQITTRSIPVPYHGPTAHVTIDSTKISPGSLLVLEEILYGSTLQDARVPFPDEIIAIVVNDVPFIVTDFGDGTYSVQGSSYDLIEADDVFTIVNHGIDNHDGTFTLGTADPIDSILVDNGDGTFVLFGPDVTDNGDGTFAASADSITTDGTSYTVTSP